MGLIPKSGARTLSWAAAGSQAFWSVPKPPSWGHWPCHLGEVCYLKASPSRGCRRTWFPTPRGGIAHTPSGQVMGRKRGRLSLGWVTLRTPKQLGEEQPLPRASWPLMDPSPVPEVWGVPGWLADWQLPRRWRHPTPLQHYIRASLSPKQPGRLCMCSEFPRVQLHAEGRSCPLSHGSVGSPPPTGQPSVQMWPSRASHLYPRGSWVICPPSQAVPGGCLAQPMCASIWDPTRDLARSWVTSPPQVSGVASSHTTRFGQLPRLAVSTRLALPHLFDSLHLGPPRLGPSPVTNPLSLLALTPRQAAQSYLHLQPVQWVLWRSVANLL